MPDQVKSQQYPNNYHTNELIDMLDAQDRDCSETAALVESTRRRSRLIRAHLAAHSEQIDFDRVFSGRRG
jgi:hypothetical protein